MVLGEIKRITPKSDPKCACGSSAVTAAPTDAVLILVLAGRAAEPTCEVCILRARVKVAEKLAAELHDRRRELAKLLGDDLNSCWTCGKPLATPEEWHAADQEIPPVEDWGDICWQGWGAVCPERR